MKTSDVQEDLDTLSLARDHNHNFRSYIYDFILSEKIWKTKAHQTFIICEVNQSFEIS